MDAKTLLDQYRGVLGLTGHAAQSLGANVAGGLVGLGNLPRGVDAAESARQLITDKLSPHAPPDAQTIQLLQAAYPAYQAATNNPVAHALGKVSDMYDQGVQQDADLVSKYLGTGAGAGVAALGAALPNAVFPEGKGASLPKYAAHEIPEIAPRARMVSDLPEFQPILPDGANARTLAREGAANARRADEGLPPPDVPPSEFAGRQAEHEAAVARLNNQPAYIKAKIPATDVSPSLYPSNFSPPPNAEAYVAMDPQTGEHLGHVSFIKRGDGVQSLRMDVAPDQRGQGIGSDLLSSAISDAHDQGLPYRSDTQVSVPAAKTYSKVPGAVRNDDVEHLIDDNDGHVGRSNNGRPVFEIPPSVDADDAQVGEMPHFDPNSYIGSQAFAEGGEVAPVLGDVARLMAEYGPKAAEAAKPLEGLPTNVSIPGHGPITPAPNPVIRQVAQNYMDQAGIKTPQPTTFIKANPARAKAIAGAYEAAQHNPNDPAVKASYEAMKRETMAQYQHIKNAGLKVDFIPPGAPDPYAASPRLAIEDINRNNHMWVFPTESGFGTESAAPLDHPMLEDSGETISGKPATANDIFRVVHDYFGHAKEGVGFRADGEENAWNQHASMYSDLARPAMTAETRGQNSWVNSGPYAEANKGASGAATIYAPQKAVILPDVYNKPDDGMMHFLHMSNLTDPQVMLDPAAYGTGMKGAEARRGGTKTISLYPANIDPNDIEQPLRGKTPYRVSVPASQMYDMSADPLGLRANAPSYSDAEDAVKDAGFLGYHTPDHLDPKQRGQARLFWPTTATRLEAEQIAGNPQQYTPAPKSTPIVDDTTDTSDFFAKGGLVRKYADGGGAELAPVLDDVAHLFATYGKEALPDQASHLANAVAENGSATYNPTSGEIHTSGYAVPHDPARSVALDSAPTPADLHDFMLQNQDAFDNPKAAVHVERDDDGNHFMHVAQIEPDFEHALAAAKQFDAPGVRELHTGTNIPTPADPVAPGETTSDPDIESYFNSPKYRPADVPANLDPDRNERPRTAWKAGKPTVDPAQRVAFPGIYNDPRQVIADSNAMVGPEDPLLQRLFGVSRQDLSDIALSRQGNRLGILPGATANPNGSAAAKAVMTPQNEQRLIDVLEQARGTPLHTGMTGWYSMDPLYERFRQIYGDEEAPAKYAHFNTLVGMASPGSDVGTEIARGTSAHWLNNEGRFDDFAKYAGISNDDRGGIPGYPQDVTNVPGHMYHKTAHSIPMAQYLQSGEMQMKSPKVPLYIGASGVPETGFQTDMPIGDAHWARGVGLADTRGNLTLKGQPVVPGASASTPEMQALGPWWRDRVAAQAGYQSVPAQATAWGAFAPYTGVASAIGAPKLEILSTQIGKLANRLGVSPETARDLVISGKAGAFRDGGSV